MFIYSPELLLIPGENSLIRVALGAVLGTLCMASGLHGFLLKDMNLIQRIGLFAASLCLISGGITSDIVGLALVVVLLGWHYLDYKKSKKLNA